MRRLLPALLAVALAGCSRSDDPEKDQAFRGAARSLETYMSALKRGDCEAAYACLSWQRRREVTLADIQRDYAEHREAYHYRAGAKIEKSHYDGFRVFIKLVNGDGNLEFVSLVPEDGHWRIEETGRSIVDIMHKNGRLGGRPHPEERAPKGP